MLSIYSITFYKAVSDINNGIIILNFPAVQRGVLLLIRLHFNCHRLTPSMDYISIGMPKVQSENRDSRMIPRERERGSEINRRQRERGEEREKSMASFFFPVNCILLSAEDSREGICRGLDGNLPPVSALQLISSLSGLFILFLPLWMSFICRVMIAGEG